MIPFHTLASGIKFWIALVAALAIGFGLLLLFGVGVFFVNQQESELENLSRELAMLELTHRSVTNTEADLATKVGDTARLAKSFADPSSPLPFVETIEALGSRLAVNTKLTLASTPAGIRGEEYVLTAEGSFQDAMTFFHSLTVFPYFIRLGDFTLAPGTSMATSTVVLSLNLALVPRP